jgi:spore coat protein H
MKIFRSLFAAVFLLFFSTTAFSQNEGNALFGYNQIHEIHFNFWQNNYWDSLVQNYNADAYMPCHISVNGAGYDSVGIKFKGNSSYNNPSDKKSFKVDLNEYISGQKIDGLKKINLNNGFKDPTFMREKLFLDFLRANNIPGPRCTYAKLYINGTYWGLYMLVEEVNKKFLEQRFGDDTGNLFKGDPSGDLKWLGASPSLYYPKYELHTNEALNDWSDLLVFLNALNNSSSQSFYDSLNLRFNIAPYLKAWAASNIFVNLDSYMGSGHNYYIYHSLFNNKFEWITWDVNEAFGGFQMGMTVAQLEALSMFHIPNPQTNRPLNQKILADNTLRSAYIQTMCDMVLNKMDTAAMSAKIDSIANVIRSAVYSDTKKFFSNQLFEDNMNQNVTVPSNPGAPTIPGLKSFYRARKNRLTTELEQNNCIAAVSGIASKNKAHVYPNPATNSCAIHTDFESYENAKIVLYDISGRLIAEEKINNKSHFLNLENLNKGVYIIHIQNAGLVVKTEKLILQ